MVHALCGRQAVRYCSAVLVVASGDILLTASELHLESHSAANNLTPCPLQERPYALWRERLASSAEDNALR